MSELLRNGRIHLTWKEEKAAQSFAENRHPRTAIAKFPDGRILLAAVDGRRPGQSVGMTLQELAEYLLSIGVSDAMNLDG
ncbi:phosphodiester glycosidase family protein, partial [Escherichia coli]|nr:phosphodiester glycosidase family protein [Escherichia coli]